MYLNFSNFRGRTSAGGGKPWSKNGDKCRMGGIGKIFTGWGHPSQSPPPGKKTLRPICQEGQSERTYPILASSSQFFLFFLIFPDFSLFFPIFPLFPIFDNFSLSRGGGQACPYTGYATAHNPFCFTPPGVLIHNQRRQDNLCYKIENVITHTFVARIHDALLSYLTLSSSFLKSAFSDFKACGGKNITQKLCHSFKHFTNYTICKFKEKTGFMSGEDFWFSILIHTRKNIL